MSLDPHWYSTIFGVLTLGGQGLSTMAFTILVLALLVEVPADVRGRRRRQVPRPRQADVRVRACCGRTSRVSQLLIIWSANLPEEIPFYLERLHGAVVSGQRRAAARPVRAAVPAAAVARRQARIRAIVKWIALFILVMRVVDITWTIGPVFRHEGSGLQLARLRGGARHGRRSGCSCSSGTWRAARWCRRTIRTSRKRWLMADTNHASRARADARRGRRRQLQRHRLVRRDPDGHDARLPVADVGACSGVRASGDGLGAPTAPLAPRSPSAGAGRPRVSRHARRSAGRTAPQPRLLVNEPAEPGRVPRARARRSCTTYGWVDKNAGIVRHADRSREGTDPRTRPAGARRRRRRQPRAGRRK